MCETNDDTWCVYACVCTGTMHEQGRIHEPGLESHQLPEESDDESEELSRIESALQNLSCARDVQLELRPCDAMEEQLVTQFAMAGCGCNKKCSSQFSADYFHDMRAQCYDLSHSELDMILLGQLLASTNSSNRVVVTSGHLERDRKKQYTTYHHAGKAVCGKTFRFLHTVGNKRLKNLTKSLKDNGLTPRIHGNTRKRLKHSLSSRQSM